MVLFHVFPPSVFLSFCNLKQYDLILAQILIIILTFFSDLIKQFRVISVSFETTSLAVPRELQGCTTPSGSNFFHFHSVSGENDQIIG